MPGSAEIFTALFFFQRDVKTRTSCSQGRKKFLFLAISGKSAKAKLN